jgi:hypothetical protein
MYVNRLSSLIHFIHERYFSGKPTTRHYFVSDFNSLTSPWSVSDMLLRKIKHGNFVCITLLSFRLFFFNLSETLSIIFLYSFLLKVSQQTRNKSRSPTVASPCILFGYVRYLCYGSLRNFTITSAPKWTLKWQTFVYE